MDPLSYVRTVLNLYQDGQARGVSMTLYVPGFLRNESATALGAVDFIMFGTITNSNNLMLSYNPNTDGSGTSSFMYPGYVNTFAKDFMGRSVTQYNGNDFISHIVNKDLKDGYAIALVNSALIQGINTINYAPNHYIRIISVDAALLNYQVSYWSWGSVYNDSYKRYNFAGAVVWAWIIK